MFATGQQNDKRRAQHAFTLVELILVMTILSVAVAVAAPSMSNFFRGRNQESEARRILSLIRYGQSRAVSEGIPVILWVDANQKTYGLEQDPAYVDDDAKAVQCDLDADLAIDTQRSRVVVRQTSRKPQPVNAIIGGRSLPQIRFQPDGSFGVSSVETISITGRDKSTIWIAQSQNGLSYEIENQNSRIHNAFR